MYLFAVWGKYNSRLVRVNVRKIVGQDGGDDLQQCYLTCQPFITRSHLISLLLISILGA